MTIIATLLLIQLYSYVYIIILTNALFSAGNLGDLESYIVPVAVFYFVVICSIEADKL